MTGPRQRLHEAEPAACILRLAPVRSPRPGRMPAPTFIPPAPGLPARPER